MLQSSVYDRTTIAAGCSKFANHQKPMNMETCPNLDEIPKDLDLVVTVSKRIKLLFVRHHFLNHKTDDDVSLERLLKCSIMTPSI